LGINYPPPVIDDRSDVFQLARLLAFVLQGDIVSGIIHQSDFSEVDDSGKLCAVLSSAMQYAKERRSDIHQLLASFRSAFGKKFAFA
jgi:hypothetical protein